MLDPLQHDKECEVVHLHSLHPIITILEIDNMLAARHICSIGQHFLYCPIDTISPDTLSPRQFS